MTEEKKRESRKEKLLRELAEVEQRDQEKAAKQRESRLVELARRTKAQRSASAKVLQAEAAARAAGATDEDIENLDVDAVLAAEEARPKATRSRKPAAKADAKASTKG